MTTIVKRNLQNSCFELRTTYLERDPFIEELGGGLYRECETQALYERFADSLAVVLGTHLLRSYNASSVPSDDLTGGLRPTREHRVSDYIAQTLAHDRSIRPLA